MLPQRFKVNKSHFNSCVNIVQRDRHIIHSFPGGYDLYGTYKSGSRASYEGAYHRGLVSVIAPCYNEEATILPFIEAIQYLDLSNYDLEVIIVNDGSRDRSGMMLEALKPVYPFLRILHFPRNFGQQQALMAGIRHGRGEVMVTIDIDLQQPPEIIPDMIRLYEQGFQVVHAIPRYRKGSSPWIKKLTSKLYYKWIRLMGSDGGVYKSNDFRSFSAQLADVLRNLPERNLYIRGILAWLCPQVELEYNVSAEHQDLENLEYPIEAEGTVYQPSWRATTLSYDHRSRMRGRTKYTWTKMIRLAMDGLTSTSIQPLRWGLLLGGSSILLAMGLSVWALYRHLIAGQTVSGWTSLMIVVLFFSSMQFILMGLMGEYIGKIFLQVRGRPGHVITTKEYIDPGNSYLDPIHNKSRHKKMSKQCKFNRKNTNARYFNPSKAWHPP